jgi:hypothetical protein
MRQKIPSVGGPAPQPTPSWLAGATIGLTILGMASSAIALGAGLALSRSTISGK